MILKIWSAKKNAHCLMEKNKKLTPSAPSGGAKFELEIFGIQSNPDPTLKHPYVSFDEAKREAMEVARARGWIRRQPDPHLGIAKLHKAICDLAEILHPGLLKIEVWPCIGTRFDYIHGVDGFFLARARRQANTAKYTAEYFFDLSNYSASRSKGHIDILDRSCFEEKLHETAERILTMLWTMLY